MTMRKNVSEHTAQEIDAEIRRFVDEAYAQAREILTEHLDDLNKLASALLEYETLTGDEIKSLLAGQVLPPRDPAPETVKPEKPPVSVVLPGRQVASDQDAGA